MTDIYDPGGPSGIDTGEAPSPDGSTPHGDGKRYIKIAVPHFNGDASVLGSYLRIGAVEPPPYQPGQRNTAPGVLDTTGEDLASLVQGFADDTRDRGPDLAQPLSPQETLPPGTTATPPDPGVPAPGTVGNRVAESAALHPKGGWRDHTDGNRVTTTRGDKVEVIRGNYKMVVLGRQDEPGGAAGWDVSGGLVDGADLDKPTAVAHDSGNVYDVEYKWEKCSDGRWGWTQVTKIGSPDTTTGSANGKQVSFTWVDEIWTYIGGAAPDDAHRPAAVLSLTDTGTTKPVKMMVSKTWAETIVQETNAVTISGGPISWSDDWNGNVTIEGPTVASTPPRVASITSTTVSEGDITTNSRSFGKTTTITEGHGGFLNSVSGGSIENHTTCTGTIFETVSCRTAHAAFDMAPTIFNLSLAVLITEIKTLIHLDIHAGMHMDMHVGEHLDIHTGDHAQFDNFHASVALEDEEIKGLHSMITVSHTGVHTSVALVAGTVQIA